MNDERGVVIRVNQGGKQDQLFSKEGPDNPVLEDNSESTMFLNNIKRVVKYHGLTNVWWTESISSLFFLIPLAKLLGYNLRDSEYRELFNIFLKNFNMKIDGSHCLSQERIQIVPDAYENKKLIIEYMQKEDEDGASYPTRLKASAISNPDVLYQNYLYAVALRVALLEDTKPLKEIQEYCLHELFSDSQMDVSGGWVHYRLPWITARVLQSLHNVDFTNRHDKDIVAPKINIALDSLLDRIYQSSFWRSGAGKWVSKWESTGICLETLFDEKYITSNKAKMCEINDVISYVFTDNIVNEWLFPKIDLSTEDNTNHLLASVCLASVLYRLMKMDEYKSYAIYETKIKNLFHECISAIEKYETKTMQDCSITEMLYYIAKAVS